MINIFQETGIQEFKNRIEKLNSNSLPQWGKMSVDQMLAHVNVSYDMTLTNKYPKPNRFQKFIVKLLAKKAVVGSKPYSKNGRTAPDFIIKDKRDFQLEKNQLLSNLNKVYEIGPDEFNLRESHSFGKLTTDEWNNLFSKHLDHHLTQFGV